MGARYETIAEWVREFGWTQGAELGLFDGRTHLYLLEQCPALNLIGVDIWDAPGFSEGETKSGEKCRCPHCEETRASRRATTGAERRAAVLAGARRAGRSTILEMTTRAASVQVPPWSQDFVFIDADHSTEGVSADVFRWKSKVKLGGRLIGHDWNMRSVRDGVRAGLNTVNMTHAKINEADDHLWWVQL